MFNEEIFTKKNQNLDLKYFFCSFTKYNSVPTITT